MSIPAELYNSIYLIGLLILTIAMGFHYYLLTNNRLNNPKKENTLLSLIPCVLTTVFIGFRPISMVFVDMAGYATSMFIWKIPNVNYSWDQLNVIFDNFRIFYATNDYPIKWFFVIISVIYFGCIWIACRKIFPYDTLLAFVVYLGAFSTFSFATNGIKAGAAASIFLLALAYHKNTKLAIIFALISWGFHHSMSMVVCSFLIVKLYNKPKMYFYIWVFSLIIAAAHISVFQSIFQSMVDEQGESYLNMQKFGKGFRLDFVLYSAMPVLVGYYTVFKKKVESQNYNTFLNMYLLTNSIWMLCMYAEFTNRIAYLSWFMYPIVLIYPFLNMKLCNKQYHKAIMVAMLHLCFTLFMTFIFYA